MNKNRLKKWEAALVLSLCITLCHGIAFGGAAGCNWWGVIFPQLAACDGGGAGDAVRTLGTQTGEAAPAGMELRFRALEWVEELSRLWK